MNEFEKAMFSDMLRTLFHVNDDNHFAYLLGALDSSIELTRKLEDRDTK